MIELVVAAAFLGFPLIHWLATTHGHWKRVDRLDVRIHVNGIRGKSSVARLVAGVLRAADYATIAKTTGSAAVVIDSDGVDHAIRRNGPATILEQLEIVERWLSPEIDALVIECMAINPDYQRVCERTIVRSQIGVITNVRHDHQDVMGETLPEIARSLLNTCPDNGVLISAERSPKLTKIMEEVTEAHGSDLVVVDPTEVSAEDMWGFGHIEFEGNVAIGLEVARQLGIPRDVAMRGMWEAQPDPGVLRVENTLIDDVRVTWANMFAINDRESTVAVMRRLRRLTSDDALIIGILNNRLDRQQRALQFADIAARDVHFDRLVTFGAYEKVVTERLVANGYRSSQILNLGNDRNPSWAEIVQEMILDQGASEVLLVGLVNIHTSQAEALLDFFEHAETSEMLFEEPVGA